MTFPVVGDPEVPTWSVRETQVAEQKTAFPDLDVMGEYRKALAWLNANRAKQKTARGMMSFLFRWLNRVQNERGGNGPARKVVPFAVAAEEAREERILEERFRLATEDLQPKKKLPHPRDEWRAIKGTK